MSPPALNLPSSLAVQVSCIFQKVRSPSKIATVHMSAIVAMIQNSYGIFLLRALVFISVVPRLYTDYSRMLAARNQLFELNTPPLGDSLVIPAQAGLYVQGKRSTPSAGVRKLASAATSWTLDAQASLRTPDPRSPQLCALCGEFKSCRVGLDPPIRETIVVSRDTRLQQPQPKRFLFLGPFF